MLEMSLRLHYEQSLLYSTFHQICRKFVKGVWGNRAALYQIQSFTKQPRLLPIQIFWISEPDTEPNLVGSLGSDRYKDTIPLWENGKFCISESDTDPNWDGSFGLARYVATLE